jgi:hypothetical protein
VGIARCFRVLGFLLSRKGFLYGVITGCPGSRLWLGLVMVAGGFIALEVLFIRVFIDGGLGVGSLVRGNNHGCKCF